MNSKTINVLVICTGNSCRSILAEVLFNELGDGRIVAHSAGSRPAGVVNARALDKLKKEGHQVLNLASKSWDAFGGNDAPAIDVVITVCDNAAGESCPIWSGSPITVHWGIPDPANATGDDSDAAFELAYRQLKVRIQQTLELPLESMHRSLYKDALQRIHDAASVKEQ